MKKLKTIAIIPARGGSKRLPNKNLLPLNGIPLIVHSINYAKENNIDKIVVSTEDRTIKDIALKNNVEVLDRPKHLAEDNATTVSVMKHVLEHNKEIFDTVILLQPTNPLRPVNLLKEALQKFKEGNYDSLMTVTRNHQKFGKIVHDRFEPYNYNIGQRSQNLEPLYYENGLLYITKASLVLENKILGENNHPFIVNHPFASVDIDTKEDFEYAAYLMKRHFE
ncbi:MAG: acylneuraminate cytidylyltransferase family protein [Lutibacter sp.]|uniref:acylneuraminate cytidylyltransferase family protein n=1 Tax=Lutibacter sp. TaxID=1925666 RepID=UPI00299CFA79|nr:acylneuraminate cytidylyltransferase family protein [Lutibacter sp.]MDX1828183.1 acylneuraminate cytidylyltransferase family protein [Lutibacter sp.]